MGPKWRGVVEEHVADVEARARGARAAQDSRGAPESPTELPKRSWLQVFKRTVKEFNQDRLTDWAAALTYYSVMSIFPALLVITTILGMLGPNSTQALIDNINSLGIGQGRDIVVNAIQELQNSRGAAGPLAIVGILGALWSSSAYVGAFIRASNAIYEMGEGRPMWKTLPLRLMLTIAMVVLLAVAAVGVVATGQLAGRLGELLGVGSAGVLVWEILKWPVIAVLVTLAFALLYWASPNVRQPKPGFRWITPGSALAVIVWLVASGGFAIYVGNFGSYNKTYGSLAGVIIFLVWLWISNIAVLLGAEFDAELARERSIEAGQRPEQEPYLPPRDTRKLDSEKQQSTMDKGGRS
jgi:membrane protein